MLMLCCCRAFSFKRMVGNDLAGKPCRVLVDLLCFPVDTWVSRSEKGKTSRHDQTGLISPGDVAKVPHVPLLTDIFLSEVRSSQNGRICNLFLLQGFKHHPRGPQGMMGGQSCYKSDVEGGHIAKPKNKAEIRVWLHVFLCMETLLLKLQTSVSATFPCASLAVLDIWESLNCFTCPY